MRAYREGAVRDRAKARIKIFKAHWSAMDFASALCKENPQNDKYINHIL